MGIFSDWQPRYAEAGIAAFPVDGKRPGVSGYLKTGSRLSETWRTKFPDANALGFAVERAGLTILDVDTPDERVLCDALDRFGPSPVIVRSGSGNFQAWYRRNGEGRKIRPDPDQPIDILGGGYVVAPPSVGGKGAYAFISGGLDDLAGLPVLRMPKAPQAPCEASEAVAGVIDQGKRNDALWRACMAQARRVDGLPDLFAFAAHYNRANMAVQLPAGEVAGVAASAWRYQCEGRNRFGGEQTMHVNGKELAVLAQCPDALALLMILRQRNWDRPDFFMANAMAEAMPGGRWARHRFTAARNFLVTSGLVAVKRQALRHEPAIYKFARP